MFVPIFPDKRRHYPSSLSRCLSHTLHSFIGVWIKCPPLSINPIICLYNRQQKDSINVGISTSCRIDLSRDWIAQVAVRSLYDKCLHSIWIAFVTLWIMCLRIHAEWFIWKSKICASPWRSASQLEKYDFIDGSLLSQARFITIRIYDVIKIYLSI